MHPFEGRDNINKMLLGINIQDKNDNRKNTFKNTSVDHLDQLQLKMASKSLSPKKPLQ